MNSDEIRLYLEDNTDLTDEQIKRVLPVIIMNLDYEQIYQQIDTIVLEYDYD